MHDEPRPSNVSSVEGGGIASVSVQEDPLETEPLRPTHHRVADFCCGRSARVQDFLRNQAFDFEQKRYARVFIFESRADDPTLPWGFYTLTAALLARDEVSNTHQKIVPKGIPVPLVRIGFMGKHDGAPKGLGAALVIDAARRVYRNADIAAWGLVLDAENQNQQLMTWYESVGFRRARSNPGVMYAPFKSLIPELNPQLNQIKK